MEKRMKTIKIFDGIKVTTADEVKRYPDMTAFDEAVKCSSEQKGEIIRALICCAIVDLTKYTTDKKRLILDLY